VHTLGSGLGRTTTGLGRIVHVLGTSQCLRGRECSSSPTSGTAYPLVRGVFALTCVQSLWWRPSDARFAGCGLAAAGALFWCVGGGLESLASRPSAWCGLGLCGSSFRFCLVGLRWPTRIHGSGLRVRHDEIALGANCPGKLLPAVRETVEWPFVLPKGVWTVSTLTSALSEFSRDGARKGT
jgi:hypothetical protein